MRVAILDVGSNTARLLVAAVGRDGALDPLVTEKAFLGLGAEIAATGTLAPGTVAATATVCARFAKRARAASVDRAEVIVTSPGRQGRASGLVAALRTGTGLNVRTLTADDEGRLAYEGAVAGVGGVLPDRVAVVDVGGGSTEIVVGPPPRPEWVRSVDLGSLRLTRLALPNDPPSKRELSVARALVREAFAPFRPPRAGLALASGGSARALAKLVGPTFGQEEVDGAIALLRRRRSAKVAHAAGIDERRATSVLAGALILRETARVLDRPLTLARGGLREGAALALAREGASAAA